MKNIQKIMVVLSVVILTSMGVSACNTMEGLGQDTRALGDAITGASQENRRY